MKYKLFCYVRFTSLIMFAVVLLFPSCRGYQPPTELEGPLIYSLLEERLTAPVSTESFSPSARTESSSVQSHRAASPASETAAVTGVVAAIVPEAAPVLGPIPLCQ